MNNRKRTRGRKFRYITFISKGEKPTRTATGLRLSTVSENRANISDLTRKLAYKATGEFPNPNYTYTKKIMAD